MQAYCVETTVQTDGSLTIRDLPLQIGEEVEVIVLIRTPPQVSHQQHRYPLHGTPVTYLDPTEPVAEDDWATLL